MHNIRFQICIDDDEKVYRYQISFTPAEYEVLQRETMLDRRLEAMKKDVKALVLDQWSGC